MRRLEPSFASWIKRCLEKMLWTLLVAAAMISAWFVVGKVTETR